MALQGMQRCLVRTNTLVNQLVQTCQREVEQPFLSVIAPEPVTSKSRTTRRFKLIATDERASHQLEA
jgi:hypothetical protein